MEPITATTAAGEHTSRLEPVAIDLTPINQDTIERILSRSAWQADRAAAREIRWMRRRRQRGGGTPAATALRYSVKNWPSVWSISSRPDSR